MRMKNSLPALSSLCILLLNSCGVRYNELNGFGDGSFKVSKNTISETTVMNVEKAEIVINKAESQEQVQVNSMVEIELNRTFLKKNRILQKQKIQLAQISQTNQNSKKTAQTENKMEGTPPITQWAFVLGILSLVTILFFGFYFLVPLGAIVTSIISMVQHGSSPKATLGLVFGIIGFIGSVFMLISIIGLAAMK